jgi:hypothetical protein
MDGRTAANISGMGRRKERNCWCRGRGDPAPCARNVRRFAVLLDGLHSSHERVGTDSSSRFGDSDVSLQPSRSLSMNRPKTEISFRLQIAVYSLFASISNNRALSTLAFIRSVSILSVLTHAIIIYSVEQHRTRQNPTPSHRVP